MRRAAAVLAAALALGGCAADGTSDRDVTVRHDGMPFTFRVPPEFTGETPDEGNGRGDVVLIRALDKVNAIGVRKVPAGTAGAETKLTILGRAVTSRVYPVAGAAGWALECQWTADRRQKVLDACAQARRSLSSR